MNSYYLDDLNIKYPKCFITTITIGLMIEAYVIYIHIL